MMNLTPEEELFLMKWEARSPEDRTAYVLELRRLNSTITQYSEALKGMIGEQMIGDMGFSIAKVRGGDRT
jgi:hypothetical protein